MVTTIYYMDEQYCSLDELQMGISGVWTMPEMGTYFDDNGTIEDTPPFDKKIRIQKVSELLLERIPGYQ